MATLKQVVSKYPYEADDEGEASPSSQHRHGLSLKTEAAQVSRELKDVLQDRLAHAGVKVLAFNLTDLSYAPEIAQAMLVRQQAEAMVKAQKKTITQEQCLRKQTRTATTLEAVRPWPLR